MNILDIHKRVLIENEALKIQSEIIKKQEQLKSASGKTAKNYLKSEILRLTIRMNMKFENAARIG